FRSRFEWGLIADIQPPDYETRMAILQKNAANCQIPIDDEVFSYIANNIRSNIRELEGALNKVIVQAKIRNAQRIDQEIAESSLRDIISERDSIITPASIIEKTCDFFHISKEDIVSQKRSREISTPRQVAMYFIRMLTDTSYDEIGRLLGGRDHTTVMSGITKITEQIKKNPPLSEQVDNLKKKIQPDV
nr:chromosomal replication initiator protein DnaA [Lachnospiraceae bacterium]